MDKDEIIEICSEWAQQDNKRIAVVLLGEPENDGTGVNYSQLYYGQPLRIALLLANELKDNAQFSAIVGTAAAAAGMKRKKTLAKENNKKEK